MEDFQVAAWPPVFEHDGSPGLWSMSKEGLLHITLLWFSRLHAHISNIGTQPELVTYAVESQTFVLHTTAVLSQKGIDRMDTCTGAIMNSPEGGSSVIFGPDGGKLSADIPET